MSKKKTRKYNKGKAPRLCKLFNIKTGKHIEAGSITEFCEIANLFGSDKYHITPILDGKRIIHKGWVNEKSWIKLNEVMEWVDIYGNEHKLSLLEIKNRFMIKAIGASIAKFVKNEKICLRGLWLKDSAHNFILKKPFKVKKYISYKGNQKYVGKTINELCDKVKIPSFASVIYGLRESSKGVVFGGTEIEAKNIFKSAL